MLDSTVHRVSVECKWRRLQVGRQGEVVVVELLLELVLDIIPDSVAGIIGGFEEAFGVLGDCLKVTN